MSQGRFLFDTNVALYFLGNQLADALPIGLYYISVISEIELLSYPNLSAKEESDIRSFLSKIETIGVRSDVTEAAIAFRRQNRMKIPDAIIVASASVSDAVLLTNGHAAKTAGYSSHGTQASINIHRTIANKKSISPYSPLTRR